MKVSNRLVQHLNDADVPEFVQLMRDCAPVLHRVIDLLTKELTALDTKIESEEFLTAPGSKERLIASLAQRRKLKEIIKLIEV